MFRRLRLRGLWQHTNFVKLWTGSTISLFGSQVTFLALPFIAALILHATPIQMGVLATAENIPNLLGALFLGVLVDRLPRRPILITADIARALLLGSIPVVALLGLLSIDYIYVIAFLVGFFTLLFDIAYGAFLPGLIERDQLVEGNSKIEVSNTLSQIAGPGIAGVLIQVLTAPLAVAVDALSFLLSATFLLTIRSQNQSSEVQEQRQSFWHELREGMQVIIKNPVLRAILASAGTMNFFGGFYQALLVLYFTHSLGLSALFYGSMYAIASCSGLVGALTNTWITSKLTVNAIILLSLAGIGIGWLLIPLAGGPQVVTLALIALGALTFGLSNTLFNINVQSLKQQITPDRLLGRVNASQLFIGVGTLPIGALLGGFVGEVLGLRTGLIIGGCGLCLGFLWMMLSSIRKSV